jgi:hypothetical protein
MTRAVTTLRTIGASVRRKKATYAEVRKMLGKEE